MLHVLRLVTSVSEVKFVHEHNARISESLLVAF